MATSFRCLAGILAYLCLAACGAGSPDDQPLLDAAGFAQPLVGNVKIWNAYLTYSGLQSNRDAALTAALVEAGQVNVEPQATQSPWWRFSMPGGGRSELAFLIGRRKLGGRSEVRNWSNGPIKCFAETISYTIDVDAGFRKAGLTEIGPFTYRLVAANDPSVGHWQVGSSACGEAAPLQSDIADAETRVADVGAALIPRLAERISGAQTEASNQVERDLAGRGMLARSAADPNVVTSRQNRRAWYLGPLELGGKTFADLETICRGIRSRAASGWRVPTPQELGQILYDSGSLSFADAPDRRLFGRFIPGQDGTYRIWTNTWSSYVNHLFVMTILNMHGNGFGGWDTLFANQQAEETLGPGDRLICVANI